MTIEKDTALKPLDQLKSVLCDPEGKCCIAGSDEDRAIVDRALQALEQPVQEPRPSFADVVRAEPTELLQKWRVLELYRAYEHCQFQSTPPAAPVPLTDDQVDAATKAWFENDIVAGRNPFRKRMRAAFAAAHGITEKGQQ